MTTLTPERWREVSPYLDEVLALTPDQQVVWLQSVRVAKPELAVLLQELLDQHRALSDKHFLENGLLENVSIVGQKLGPYQVEAQLGIGGMGEVYRARDTRLDRTVAIKVLPRQFSLDPERRLRFEREAKAISALQNPHICALYDVGREGDLDYLVMEYLEGQTVCEWITRPGPEHATGRLLQLLDLSIQIARGLEAAHQKGIVHRDIKPANIFITCNGDAKILDFGVAKSLAGMESGWEQRSGAGTSSPVLHPTMTRPGLALGTPLYLSPEQIDGGNVDSRSDLFSFGLVLYEMATGQRAFTGDSLEQIRYAIVHTEPLPIRKLNPQLPAELERIVSKALNKDSAKRYESAADLSADLKKLKQQTESRKRAAERWRSPWTLGVTAVLAAALIAGGLYYRSRLKRILTEKDTIVLADFANNTGDKVFNSTLNQALSVTLSQSPFLNVISDNKVGRTLQSMERPTDTPLVPEIAREVCQRAGSRAYIAGSIASLGNQYVVALKAVNCRSGDVLAQQQVTAASKETVLTALGNAATKLRADLGESLASLQKFDLPLEDATTSSLQALEAFSTGEALFRTKGQAAALPYHQRAIELDPNFALAYMAVGIDYNSLGETTRASQYFSKAFHLREHASRRENMTITADYYLYVTGELDKAEQALHNLLANYPRFWGAHIDLGNVYTSEGLYSKGSDEYREATSVSRDVANNYGNLANTLLALQRFDETQQLLQEAQSRKLDEYIFHLQWYALAFLKSDPQAMADQQQWFAGRPEVENNGLALASDTEAYVGHVRKSRELTIQSVNSAIRADSKESGAIYQENAALREAAFGNTAEARRLATKGLKLAPESQGVQLEAALTFALTRDTSLSTSLMKEVDQQYPLDTQMHALWLAPIRAQLALNRRTPAAALAALPDIGAMGLGQITFLNNISCLYPAYIRGNAYLAAGQGAAAATEFQAILDHSGIVWNCWTGALAHLGVARANALKAKLAHIADADAARARALNAYKDFFVLWKDADPDIPVLKQAKAEYAKLLP
jgi:eukaryotic-like serine/threonine-protein kinase